MNRILSLLAVVLVALAAPLRAADDYPLTVDSKPQEGVPKGEVLKFSFDKSAIFPGTTRDYWIYVPRQYDPATPACVYVNQDGVQWQAPTVFDNLIAKREMPVTIGVFVMHGRVPAPNPNALDRFNRSFEYDGLGDNYARFLLEELLPEVETKTTGDGRPLRLSKSGNDRAIGGSSSGAIGAFTAAWERPDAFSRVFSAIGTYVGLRGGNDYPTLIRKVEPKPLRVFLQDGSSDNNIYAGDWWMANQEMERALSFAGYEVNHVWGTGGHSGQHGTAIFPDVMRWLWKDWPQPVKAGAGSPQMKDILLPGEGWQMVRQGIWSDTAHLVVNARGEVFYSSPGGVLEVESGKAKTPPLGHLLAFGPGGRCYSGGAGSLVIQEEDGQSKRDNQVSGVTSLVALHDGSVYVSKSGFSRKEIGLITAQGEKRIVAESAPIGGSLAVSPDQTLLYASESYSHWVYSYQIQPDGSLQHKQRYFHLHVPDWTDGSAANGMCVDKDGRLYVATFMGLQVCDQPGRVNCILPVPGGLVTSVVLGGPDLDTLYAATGLGIYKRKVKVKGAPSFLPPVKPAAPRL